MRPFHIIAPVMATAMDTINFQWDGSYGPDGPWQATRDNIGSGGGQSKGSALWPGWDGESKVLMPDAGGNYTPTNLSTALFTSIDVKRSRD